MKVTHDELMFCDDCMFVAVNSDYSGLSNHPETEEKRTAEIGVGLERLGKLGHLVPAFDSETGKGYEEFSWSSCACCQSGLGGSRHEFAILGRE